MALSDPIYRNEDKARAHLEALRWPNGPVCPHCGGIDNSKELEGESTRPGVYKCRDCRQPFTVTVGTVFERSKIPLTKWLTAVYLMCSSKKGISAHQIHRTLDITYKTAWFMSHPIREAMRTEGGLFGAGGGVVEADETYIGRKPGRKMRRGHGHKGMVFTLVERGGRAKSIHITGKMFAGIKRAVFADHQSVNHSAKEYVRGDAHTNTIEGFFSVFKRGMTGVYQHCCSDHLHRYLHEFDFRYSNRIGLGVDDKARADAALVGIAGKRLTYKGPCHKA